MNLSEAFAQIPRRAARMPEEDYIYYINNVVVPDIDGIVQAKWPDTYEKKIEIVISIVAQTITNMEPAFGGGTRMYMSGISCVAGDVVIIEGTNNYNGKHIVKEATADSIVVAKSFVAVDAGTLKAPFRYQFSTLFQNIRRITDFLYGDMVRAETSIFDNQTLKYDISGRYLVIPAATIATDISIYYSVQTPLISTMADSLPWDAQYHRTLLPIINYGAALAWFRDRRKADDIQIFYELYEQSKRNIAVLRSGTL